ncbi:alpha/beta-hydrolase [Lentinula aciculospora]|uniref:Carboxylic ester hydrolase n=1 Tax=Lentinula aciculospora TaxID=153920 RepID=A0A9W9DPI6_9AGAR|nr:alpha/beta-hydrolase [Lentinula aciculospora]
MFLRVFNFPLAIAASLALSQRLSCVLSASIQAGDVVDTGYAQYRGNRSFENTVAYLGIPYAEPPLGDRRFRAPLPLNKTRIAQEAGSQIVDAMQYPDFCIQGSTGDNDAGGAGSEDCLKLNVYAPFSAKSGDNLPVLVYFHGGGFVYGNPANWPFDSWIHQSPNIVIASVYYRLDSFGFLNIPEFSDTDSGDFNAGFLDQTESLRWIRAHISAFGGNAEKVTINGQSAGAASVELHLVANQDRLFSGAIAQSVGRSPVETPENQVPVFNFYAETAGCSQGSVTEKLACLRNASIGALARAQDAPRIQPSAFTGAYPTFNPVVDGKIITDYPSVSIQNGNFAKVPLIVGATSNETGTLEQTLPETMKTAFPGLTVESADEFLEIYPLNEFSSQLQRNQTAIGESMLRCAREIMGGAFANTPKSWTYRYNQPNPTQGMPGFTAHAAENWMMFNGINTGFNGSGTFTPMTPVETAFAEELIAYWLSFVRSGNPNTFKLDRAPTWTEYLIAGSTNELKQRIVLQQDPDNSINVSGSFIEMEPKEESARCKFVASKAEEEQN